MTFTFFCVGLVVTMLTALVTLLVGQLLSIAADEDFGFGPWLLSVMMLGGLITKELIDHGII